MKKRVSIVAILSILLMFISCKKREESLRWNTDWSAPVAHGELGIEDLLSDTLLSVAADSSVWLVFERELYRLDINEITGALDTSFIDTFALPIFAPISVNPGQFFLNQPEENNLNLEGALMKEVVIGSGRLDYELYSTIQGNVIYTYQILSATDENGAVFSEEVFVPAASLGSKSHVSGFFALSGYTLNLRGNGGNSYNKILTSITCKVDPNFDSAVSVSNQDTLYISNSISNVQIASAEGYFGMHDFSSGPTGSSFEGFDKFVSGGFSMDEVALNFHIENGVGVDALFQINEIKGLRSGMSSVSLVHDIIGVIQSLNRAYRIGDEIYPSDISTVVDETNSNIIDFLELMPDSIGFDVNVSINPAGNISSYNDFVNVSSPLRMYLDAEIPLRLGVNNLALVDTLSVTIADTSALNELTLFLSLENGFPLGASVAIATVDANDHVANYIFAPNDIPTGVLGINGKVETSSTSSHEIYLSPKDLERLKKYKKLILKVTFNTPSNQVVQLYDYYKMAFKITANASIGITVK